MELNKEFIQNLRQEYRSASLSEKEIENDPFQQFKKWFNEALEAQIFEPNVMTLATVDKSAKPHARIVLLKGFDNKGFTFFTNYNSHKGKQLAENPYGALVFFWAELERQVRIEGKIEKVDPSESDQYFQSRPRMSQIGASASPQSQVIESRNQLEQEFEQLNKKLEGQEIPRPLHWGGFQLIPTLIEFWQGRPSRLHDRIQFTLHEGKWIAERLAP